MNEIILKSRSIYSDNKRSVLKSLPDPDVLT